jgi:hypothetical protein
MLSLGFEERRDAARKITFYERKLINCFAVKDIGVD